MNRRQVVKRFSAVLSLPLLQAVPLSAATEAQESHTTNSKHRWVHPGVFQRESDLQFMKKQVLAGRQPWKDAWDRMLAVSTASLDFKPVPYVHIVRGSYGAGQKGVNELNATLESAHAHVLQWVVTGREEHAEKAASILDAWSTVLADFSGNDSMLLGGWTGGQFCNVAEILRHTWKGWQTRSIQQFERMLRTVYVPLLYDFFPEANGNWDGAIMHSLLAIAVFCEDMPLLERVLAHYRFGPGSSGITRYVYPNGQCEESTRDQGHTQLGLGYFALTSLIAWNQGVDIFSEAQDRLALGYEYTSRYMLGMDVFSYGTISQQVRGRFDDWYEVVLQHFRHDKSITMPFTEQAAAAALPRSKAVLTFFRGEGSEHPNSPPVPSNIALKAGALPIPTSVSTNAVSPEESIQAAIDRAASLGGGIVSLTAGTHQISEAIRVPSGITLAGVGRDTVIFLAPNKQGPALLAGSPDLRDVTIRDLLIEAGPLEKPTRDPNQDRRPLSSQLAAARGGISFTADGDNTLKRICLNRVSIRNATISAVEIFGADNIQVLACDLSASGGAVSPGKGKHHCLKLDHVSNVTVSGSRLVDSFWGCGLAVSFGKNITVRDCELARNTLNGARFVQCVQGLVEKSLAEGNSAEGIGLPIWNDPNIDVILRDNILRNNVAERGVE
jgi:Alginate lyase